MIRILHLSDIHLGTADNAETYRQQLETDLKIELKIEKLEYLVISGDVANTSTPEEYDAAEKMLTTLMAHLGIKEERLIVVPGNHDLNWDISRKEGYRLIDKADHTGKLAEGMYVPVDDEVIRLRVAGKYRERFRHFSAFHHQLTGTPYSLEYREQGAVIPFEDDAILFAGLNSAWEIDQHYPQRSGIHPNAVTHVLDHITGIDCRDWLRIAVCHHPVTGPDMMKNVDFLERLAVCGFQIVMHGHIHEAQQGFYQYDPKREIHIIGAGTFGVPSKKDMVQGIPHQYNLLEYDPDKNEITVRTRKKEKPEGAWSADPRWGDKNDPKPYYVRPLKGKEILEAEVSHACGIHSEEKETRLEIPQSYQDWVSEWCGHMDVDRLQEKGSPITIRLPEVFVNLYTTPSGKSESTDPEALLKNREHIRDVEDVIAEANDLIIKGEAGSGKTTLLKHFVYMCFKEPGWKGTDGVLPVLVFLKDLGGFPVKNAPQNEETADAILRHCFRKTGCGLDMETVKKYCSAGKAVFFLDGLDEIGIELRNLVVNALTAYRRVCRGGRFVFSGRPHGVEGEVVNRFGTHLIPILPLGMDQVEAFIRKWFQSVARSASNRVAKTAEGMISEIRHNPGVERLIYNPLMLTAVCILYHDQRELPGQRAELYKKFVENMLHRGKRFTDPERVHEFLMTLAHHIHTKGQKGIDKPGTLAILEKAYPNPDLTDIGHRAFLRTTLERIEPNCGLLKYDAGQLTFRHLTFQEFLTAEYIKDRETKYDDVIREFWENDWYKEVVELLVGLLSIDSRQWANDLVENALGKPDVPPYRRWRLGARSVLDIHKDRRDPRVEDKARKNMVGIMVSDAIPKDRADAGEILGWLGDPRDLEGFVKIPDETYDTSNGSVTLASFEMAKYPVTNQWYKKFVDAGGYDTDEFWTTEGLKWRKHTEARHPEYWHDRRWNCPNHPVVGVCWWEAVAFCRWLTIANADGFVYRLPTELEWEAAAAGKENRKYPWGTNSDKNKCNCSETDIGKTSAVGCFNAGNTPDGLSDMSGNVWEWTCSNYKDSSQREDFPFDRKVSDLYLNEKYLEAWELYEKTHHLSCAIRGGAWYNKLDDMRSSFCFSYNPGNRFNNWGFRCART